MSVLYQTGRLRHRMFQNVLFADGDDHLITLLGRRLVTYRAPYSIRQRLSEFGVNIAPARPPDMIEYWHNALSRRTLYSVKAVELTASCSLHRDALAELQPCVTGQETGRSKRNPPPNSQVLKPCLLAVCSRGKRNKRAPASNTYTTNM